MSNSNKSNTKNIEFGLMLILIGCGALAYKMGYVHYSFVWWELVAGLMVVLGTVKVLCARSAYQLISGLSQIGLAGLFYAMFAHLWDLEIRVHWPLFLIAFGIINLLKYITRPKNEEGNC